jgi:hypothetical protein
MELTAKLANDWQVCRLLDLKELPVHDRLGLAPGTGGPFLVLQRAHDPQDPRLEADDFALTCEGRWLPLYAVLQLPDDERLRLALFTTAAEALTALQALGSKVELDHARIPGTRRSEAELAAGDAFNTTVLKRRDAARTPAHELSAA